MTLKRMLLALLAAGWTASSTFAFTTVEHAAQAVAGKPPAPGASQAKAPDEKRSAEAADSRSATGSATKPTPTKPSASDKGSK